MDAADAPVLAAILAALAAAAVLVRLVEPAWWLSAGVALSVFSGHWDLLDVPFGLDRIALAIGVAAVLVRVGPARTRPPLRLGAVHWLLLLAAVFAICSALWSGTLGDTDARFRLLDGFALTSFVLFAVAPVAFAEHHQRVILLGTLVVLGGYLAITSLAEATGLDALVVPGDILDPAYGIHAERARGPFLEAAGNGLALVCCAVAAIVGARTFTGRGARHASVAVAVLDVAALPGTYTRAAWIAGVLAALVVLLGVAELRRWAPGVLAGAGLALLLAVAVVPGFGDRLDDRATDRGPVHVRENTNAAALHMVAARPLAGVGWNLFAPASAEHFRMLDDTPPRAGFGEPAHNVLLSRAAELGIVGAALWLIAFVAAIGGALVRPAATAPGAWRAGLLAIAVAWATISALGPGEYAFPLLLMFTWAGVLRGT